jgi:hypothetical protein
MDDHLCNVEYYLHIDMADCLRRLDYFTIPCVSNFSFSMSLSCVNISFAIK